MDSNLPSAFTGRQLFLDKPFAFHGTRRTFSFTNRPLASFFGTPLLVSAPSSCPAFSGKKKRWTELADEETQAPCEPCAHTSVSRTLPQHLPLITMRARRDRRNCRSPEENWTSPPTCPTGAARRTRPLTYRALMEESQSWGRQVRTVPPPQPEQ